MIEKKKKTDGFLAKEMLDGNDRIESQIKICLYDSSKTGSRATMTKRNFSVGFSEADDYGY